MHREACVTNTPDLTERIDYEQTLAAIRRRQKACFVGFAEVVDEGHDDGCYRLG